jgi:outer membrane protein
MIMRRKIRVGFLLTYTAIAGGTVGAQTAPVPKNPVPQNPAAAQTAMPGGAPLTIEDARRLALQNHPHIRVAQSAAAAANDVTTQVRSAYYPNVYGSLTGVEADSGTRIGAGGLNNSIIFNRFATGVAAEQLVTDLGRTKNLVASSRLAAQAANETVNVSRADVRLNVDRAYYGVLRAQAVLTVAQQTVKQRETVSEQITTLAKNKLRSGLDVSFADVNLSQARLLLVQAQNDLQAAYAVLAEALGNSQPQQYQLTEPAEAAAVLPAIQDAMTAANRDRPELASQRLQVDSAQHFATAERDLILPSLSLAGVAGEIPFRQAGLPLSYSAIGFNVHIPIFNGKLFSARHAEAEDRAREEQAVLNEQQAQIVRDVQLAWLAANTASQNVTLTAELFAEANKALDLAQARYDLGLGSIVELSQAQLNQAQAGIAQAGAKYDYATRLAELAYQQGALR